MSNNIETGILSEKWYIFDELKAPGITIYLQRGRTAAVDTKRYKV